MAQNISINSSIKRLDSMRVKRDGLVTKDTHRHRELEIAKKREKKCLN